MKHNFKAIILYIVLIAIVVFSVSSLLGNTKQDKLIYSDIVEYFKTDSVVSFVVDEDYLLTMKVVDTAHATVDEATGKVLTYSAVIRSIWGSMDTGSIKKLQVNMANIRKKLGCTPGDNRYFINELGVGYRMLDEQ